MPDATVIGAALLDSTRFRTQRSRVIAHEAIAVAVADVGILPVTGRRCELD